MLQWMGGSRRKVTTSRKSTQKRQKQYFEQRKRKQQHHQTDVENYFDGNNTYGQQNKNNKSLDVLSLLNLSAASKEPNSCCPQAWNIEGITLSPNHQTISCPRTVHTNEATQMSPPRIEEESSSCFLVDTVCPKNLSVGASESQKQELKGNWNILNLSKMPTEHQLSVIDILGDDGPSSNFEERAGHEAHVAFSIQGLGKVDAETPVHSPVRPERNFLYGQYLPPKERIKAHSSFKNLTGRPDNLEHKLDTMMRDIDMPLYRSHVEPSFCSRSTEDLFSSPKLNLSNKKFSPVPDYDMFEDILEDEELFGKERRKNIWKASSSYLPYGIIDHEGYGSPCKDKLDQIDSGYIQYADRNYEHQDFSFETHHWKKSASMISPLEINHTDSPALFPKRRMVQYFEEPSVPNINCSNYSLGTRQYGLGDCKKQTQHSCSAFDDTKESFCLPSEESCFSAAVKGDILENIRSRHGINRKRTMETKFSHRNIFGEGRFCSDMNNPQQRGNSGGLENFPVSSNISTPHYSTTTARERMLLHPENHGFSQDIFDLGEVMMGSDDLYTEDSFAASPQAGQHFDKCRDFPGEHSHCCKRRTTEEPSIRQPTRIIVLNPTSKRECSFDLQRDVSEASNVSSSDKKAVVDSSYLEDQWSDTRKEPSCRTPEVTETLEHAEETSSCAEIPVAIEEIHDIGDPNKAQSE